MHLLSWSALVKFHWGPKQLPTYINTNNLHLDRLVIHLTWAILPWQRVIQYPAIITSDRNNNSTHVDEKLPRAEKLILLHVGRLYEYYVDFYIYSKGKQIHNYFVFKLA